MEWLVPYTRFDAESEHNRIPSVAMKSENDACQHTTIEMCHTGNIFSRMPQMVFANNLQFVVLR
jgi:hypothetical protein